MLLNDEQIESLEVNGLQIIQSKTQYRFTTDAVLLANFVSNAKGKTCADLGTGSGIIAILLAGKKLASKVDAVELQPQLADMASRSVQINNLQQIVTVINEDMRQFANNNKGKYDIVVCNPPYRKVGSGERQLATHLAICRHEVAITLDEVIKSASLLLNNKGSFYIVHQSQRLAELCYLANKYKLEVKEILPVCSRQNTNPNLVLARMVKGGNVDCILHSPLVLYTQSGEYTQQALKYYQADNTDK